MLRNMGAVKIKGNWNQNKQKLKNQFSNFDESDEEIFNVEEELLRGLNTSKKSGKKKSSFKKELDW
jgi:hypothetical protein